MNLVEQQEHIVEKENFSREDEFTFYLEKAKDAIRNKEFSRASDYLLEAMKYNENSELYLLLGTVYEDLHSYEKAVEFLKKGIEIDSREPELFVELGTLYYKLGEKRAAEFYYHEALEIRPMSFSTNFNLGIIHRDRGEWQKAIEFFSKAELVAPKNFLTLYNLGYCYQQVGDLEKSALYYRRSVNENPISPEANFAYGNILKDKRNWEKAKEYFKTSLHIKPDQLNVMTNLGIVFHYLGRFEESKDILLDVLDIEKDNFDAKINLAANYYELGDFQKSKELYEEILRTNPDDAIAHFNYSLLLFTIGEYEKALEEYEWRFKTWGKKEPLPNIPYWKGENLNGKRVIVFAEQGLGDAIQFVRYVNELRKENAYVILQTRELLFEIFRNSDIADEIIIDLSGTISADYKVFLMSIPGIVRKFPLEVTTPYIKSIESSSDDISAPAEKFKVGIVWRGNDKHIYDFKRSVNIKTLKKLLVNENVEFYSFQYDVTKEEEVVLRKYGVYDLSDRLPSFLENAKFLTNVDLVISIDSAVAHLAGAMGKEVWVAIPKVSDWRWNNSNGSTPWYKSMRLYRQNVSGEWKEVFERIEKDLKRKVKEHRRELEQELALLNFNGLKLLEKGKKEEALIYFKKYLVNNPNDNAVLLIVGSIEFELKHLEEAKSALQKVVENNPNDIEALKLLGEIYFREKNFNDAIKCFEEVLQVEEDDKIYNELALSYQSIGKPEDAVRNLKKALELKEVSGYYLNLANNLYFIGELDEAIYYYNKSLEKEGMDSAHIGKSFAYLVKKDFLKGFKEYDWAIKAVSKVNFETDNEWDGEKSVGKKILIYTEQGIGDSIQFMRFLKQVKEKGLYVVVGTSSDLVPFFETSPFVDEVVTERKDDYDYSLSIMKLPKVLKLKDEADFMLPENVFTPDNATKEKFAKSIPTNTVNVAIMWHTDSDTPTSKQRSLDWESLRTLLKNRNVNFYLTEKELDPQLIKEIEEEFNNVKVIADSLWNIAAFVANMDLVVSIDSSLLHIAASQNIPVWALLPKYCDWRWTFEGEKSYWYPSVKLFRQKEEGNWDELIVRVNNELEKLIASGKATDVTQENLLAKADELLANGDFINANELLNRYSEKFADNEQFNFKFAFVKQNLSDLEGAITRYQKTLEINPLNVNALNNISVAIKDIGKYSEAEQLLKITLQINPDNFNAYNNLGLVKDATGNFSEAVELFKKALSLNGNFADAEINLANSLSTLGKYNEALKVLNNLLVREPSNVKANFNKGLILLASGNYKTGFNYYEWRRKLPENLNRTFSKPELREDPVAGKKILVYDEQGYGDTIQFARFIELLANEGAEVIFQTHGALQLLMKNCKGVSTSVARTSLDDSGLEYDFHIPLLSLPAHFGLGFEECAMNEPYIKVEITKVSTFREKYFTENKIKIGLVWEGKKPLSNAHRSATLEDYLPFTKLKGVRCFSLQVGEVARQHQSKMNKNGIVDMSNEINDFSDTAAILKNLDLLITIDTSVAHLAGALGVKTFLLLSQKADWRWGNEDKTIWYPSMKIFRQDSFGNWTSVINKILNEMNPMKWSSNNNQ